MRCANVTILTNGPFFGEVPIRPGQIQLLAAIGETFLPPRNPSDWHGGDHNSLAIMQDVYHHGPWFMRFVFMLAAHMLNLSPLLLMGKARTFMQLDAAERDRCLQRFAHTMPFALVFAPLRAFLAIAVYSRPDAQEEAGYHNRGKARA